MEQFGSVEAKGTEICEEKKENRREQEIKKIRKELRNLKKLYKNANEEEKHAGRVTKR
jgi:hypothetical protein